MGTLGPHTHGDGSARRKSEIGPTASREKTPPENHHQVGASERLDHSGGIFNLFGAISNSVPTLLTFAE